MEKVRYYKDELNDDFAGNDIKTKKLPENYKYIKKNPVWKVAAFILYYIVAVPVVTIYNKLVHGERIKNRRVLKGYRKNGYYIYGNHTMVAADAFTPGRVTFPKKANIIVSPDAVSIPVVSSLVEMLGGIPIATSLHGMKGFTEALKSYSDRGKVVMIYPEAHIWPYYTGGRPFKDVSFKYPAKDGRPVFCFTRVFKKRLLSCRPKVTVYVDGPFFPQEGFSVKQNQKYLRDCVYETMKKRVELNEVEYVKYVKVAETYAESNAEKPQTSEVKQDYKPELKPEFTPAVSSEGKVGTVIGNEPRVEVYADSATNRADDTARALA